MKHIHFIVKQEIIDGLDRYKSKYVSRTQLLEQAIIFFTEYKDKQVVQKPTAKGSAGKTKVVDWIETI